MANDAASMNLSFESDALQTVGDKSLGTRVSADSDDNSVVQAYTTKAGSKVIPGRSGHDDKEACGILREFEEFYPHDASERWEFAPKEEEKRYHDGVGHDAQWFYDKNKREGGASWTRKEKTLWDTAPKKKPSKRLADDGKWYGQNSKLVPEVDYR